MNTPAHAIVGQVRNLPRTGTDSGRLEVRPTAASLRQPVGQVRNLPERTASVRLRPSPRAAVVMILAVFIAGLARGDELVPLPPLPEDVVIDPAVVPAALETGRPLAGPLPLEAAPQAAGSAAARPLSTGPLGDWTVLSAIAAAFCLLGLYRFQHTRRQGRTLPADVFEVLGEATLGGPQAVRVVRFGPRTLLLGVSATGCQTLATLDDPQVTDRIVAACLGERPPRPSAVPRPAPRPAAAASRRPASGEEAA